MKIGLVLLLSLILLGCVQVSPSPSALNSSNSSTSNSGLTVVKNGDKVAVDYLGWTKDDGKVFDTSIESEAIKAKLELRPSYSPLEFTVGAGQMIKGFDSGVVGMKVGEEKTVTLLPAEAYGEKRSDLIASVPVGQLTSSGVPVKVGTQVSSSTGMRGTIVEVNATHAKIDFNMELAGKTLVFKIIMRKIN